MESDFINESEKNTLSADVFEEDFLSADCTDSSLLGEEVEEADQEVFTLELQRGERGLGLALVDARVSGQEDAGFSSNSVESPCTRTPHTHTHDPS